MWERSTDLLTNQRTYEHEPCKENLLNVILNEKENLLNVTLNEEENLLNVILNDEENLLNVTLNEEENLLNVILNDEENLLNERDEEEDLILKELLYVKRNKIKNTTTRYCQRLQSVNSRTSHFSCKSRGDRCKGIIM